MAYTSKQLAQQEDSLAAGQRGCPMDKNLLELIGASLVHTQLGTDCCAGVAVLGARTTAASGGEGEGTTTGEGGGLAAGTGTG